MPQTTTSPDDPLPPSPLAELLDQLADMLDDSGLTLADLLADLPRIREEIYHERYQTNPEE